MKKKVLLVAAAALFLLNGSVEASSVKVAPSDSSSTSGLSGLNKLGQLGKNGSSGKVIGNLIGSLMQNNSSSKTESVADTTSNVNKANDEKKGSLGNILGSLFGNSSLNKLTVENLCGTWNYVSSKCVLESEDIMKKAGSELIVAPIEKRLNKGLERAGMKPGSFSITFNQDGTFISKVGSRTMNGKYELNAENKQVKLTYLKGLVHTTLDITLFSGKLGLLYDSDKLLTLLGAVSSISNSAAIKSVNTLLKSYDGMKIGMEYAK